MLDFSSLEFEVTDRHEFRQGLDDVVELTLVPVQPLAEASPPAATLPGPVSQPPGVVGQSQPELQVSGVVTLRYTNSKNVPPLVYKSRTALPIPLAQPTEAGADTSQQTTR